MVSFTGSTRAGKRVTELARADRQARRARARRQVGRTSSSTTPTSTTAVAAGVFGCFLNSGQTCTRATRACSCRATRQDEVVADRQGGGRGRSPSATRSTQTPRLGPLVSAAQRDRVRGYIQKGIDEGATLVDRRRRRARGPRHRLLRAPDGLRRRRQRHDDRPGGDLRPGAVDHALRRRGRRRPHRQRHASTGSPAACGRATSSGPRRVARRMRTGQVDINGGSFNSGRPVRRLQAVGHTAASSASSASRSSSRRSRCSSSGHSGASDER